MQSEERNGRQHDIRLDHIYAQSYWQFVRVIIWSSEFIIKSSI